MFTRSVLSISVAGYFLLYAAVKAISYFILALIVMLICVLAKNNAIVYMITGVVIAFQLLLYSIISPLSEFGLFKFLNIIALTQPNEIFKNYFNINAFGEPLNLIISSIVAAAFLIAILLIALFAVSRKQAFATWNNNAVSDFLNRFSGKQIHTCVFKHEAYKTFISNRALLILLLLAVIQWNSYTNYRGFITMEEMYYKNYVEQAGGEVTQETFDFIDAEQARFNEIELSIILAGERHQNGEISYDDYNMTVSGLQQMLAPQKGFEIFTERARYIKDIPGGQVIFDKGFNILFGVNGYSDDMSQVLLIVIFMIIMLSPVFSAEKENGMFKLIKPTPKGLTWFVRFSVSFIVALITIMLVNLPFIINTLSFYGTGGSDAVIQSLPAFSEFPLSVSVRGYLGLLLITRIIGAAVAVFFIQLISLYSNKKTTALLISLSVIAIPAAVYFTGAEAFAKFGVNSLLGGNAALSEGILSVVIIFGAVLCAGASRKVIDIKLKRTCNPNKT
jgi:hypothetical protein